MRVLKIKFKNWKLNLKENGILKVIWEFGIFKIKFKKWNFKN